MAESENSLKTDLLDMVLEVIQGQRGQSINELISLLALSNLLGIISFLNTQELKYEVKSSQSKSSTSELKEMAATLLASMGTGDKKINPAALINLMKTLSAADSSEGSAKGSDKSDDKKKD
ncbi:MAG: hypothetical protein WBJ82_03145 [Tepidanaerobacteraceae bacterium]|nr:hypothetical protein [Tepidanaerobacteraceae bacterium]HQE05545.1 hypothetical protein [Tepidanaerobacteraceae bacterium]